MKSIDFIDKLNKLAKEKLKTKDRIIITIMGKAGTGKSTLGKYFRKKGFGDFSRFAISVIDDGVMSLDLFYLFNKRVKFKTNKKDELEPFLKLLPSRKKVIFYVNQTPELRLSKTDILLYLTIDEETREKRLINRDGKFNKQSKIEVNIKHGYLIEVDMSKYDKNIFLGKKR